MADSVHLRYGQSGLEVRLPPHAQPTLIGKRPLAKLADPHAAVRDALAKPVGANPYREIVRGRKSACILICDITRPVPNRLFLRPLIEGLLDAGVARERITVLVATGLHRPNEGEELAEVVGDPWVFENVRVENHFARDDAAHVDFGFTPGRRTPVKLDRRFVEADVRIATGLVEPHFMAGYSGGRKVIAPGHRARGHDPHLPQRPLHGGPARGPVQPRRQPAARGAARDRRHAGRGLRAQHRDRRRPRSRPCQFRRGHREPSRGRRLRVALDSRSDRAPFLDRPHIGRGSSARQDVLPDGQGHGHAARHPRAGRHADRGLGLLGRVSARPSSATRRRGCARSVPTRSCNRSWPSGSPTSTNGRPRCSSSPCASGR